MDDSDAIAVLTDLLSETREELTRADTKASLCLAGTAVVVGAVGSGVAASSWRPSDLSNVVEWMFWLGAALTVVSLAFAVGAIMPRYRSSEARSNVPRFFGEVISFANAPDLLSALKDGTLTRLERLAQQVLVVSRIVRTKYLLLELSLWGLISGPALCGVATLVG